MEKIQANFISEKITSNSREAKALFSKSKFGEKYEDKILYSYSEALYLLQNNKMDIFNYLNKKLTENEIAKKFQRIDKKFKTKYFVFKDLRNKGYIVKTALKYGAEFRIYEKNKNSKSSHSKWILFPVSEHHTFTWQDFTAKNRVAHSTKKNLLIAIVDDEGSVSYFEIKWIKT